MNSLSRRQGLRSQNPPRSPKGNLVSTISWGADLQELDCDVCRLLRKILQRLEQVERQLSSIKQFDPVYSDLQSRVGKIYTWPTVYSEGDTQDRFIAGDIVWGGPDQVGEWVVMDQLHEDRWMTLPALIEEERISRRSEYLDNF